MAVLVSIGGISAPGKGELKLVDTEVLAVLLLLLVPGTSGKVWFCHGAPSEGMLP